MHKIKKPSGKPDGFSVSDVKRGGVFLCLCPHGFFCGISGPARPLLLRPADTLTGFVDARSLLLSGGGVAFLCFFFFLFCRGKRGAVFGGGHGSAFFEKQRELAVIFIAALEGDGRKVQGGIGQHFFCGVQAGFQDKFFGRNAVFFRNTIRK